MDEYKSAGDVVSVSVALGSLIGWLPSIAAFFTIVWTAIRIWETQTVQSWIARWKSR